MQPLSWFCCIVLICCDISLNSASKHCVYYIIFQQWDACRGAISGKSFRNQSQSLYSSKSWNINHELSTEHSLLCHLCIGQIVDESQSQSREFKLITTNTNSQEFHFHNEDFFSFSLVCSVISCLFRNQCKTSQRTWRQWRADDEQLTEMFDAVLKRQITSSSSVDGFSNSDGGQKMSKEKQNRLINCCYQAV